MSNPDYSLPMIGLNCPIPHMGSDSGRFAIFSVELPPALVVVVVVAVVVASDLLQPRGGELVKFAHLWQRRNKRLRAG